MSKHITIEIDAKQYEGHDDCLTAAAVDYNSDNPEAADCDLNARWKDNEREVILLDVPRLTWKSKDDYDHHYAYDQHNDR